MNSSYLELDVNTSGRAKRNQGNHLDSIHSIICSQPSSSKTSWIKAIHTKLVEKRSRKECFFFYYSTSLLSSTFIFIKQAQVIWYNWVELTTSLVLQTVFETFSWYLLITDKSLTLIKRGSHYLLNLRMHPCRQYWFTRKKLSINTPAKLHTIQKSQGFFLGGEGEIMWEVVVTSST